jgi:hypothetical protein
MRNLINTGLYIFISFFLLTSCISNRKIAVLNESISKQQKLENKLDSTLTALNNFREEKNITGELDDSSNLLIQKMLNKEITASQNRAGNLKDMQTKISGKKVKRKVYKNMITIITVGDSVILTKMETVDFVDQLLKQETFAKFNTAAFFSTGGYKIPEERLPEAKSAFAPIVDSLLGFVQRYPNFTLRSSIITSGYADGQGFSPGPLVDTLVANIGKKTATKEELNIELSRLRAEEVTGILMEILKEKIKLLHSSAAINTRFYNTGKGEEYPNKKIRNYQTDDERRRIVVIYWNALPQEN